MGLQAAVAGASGYAGGELLRLLSGHPDLEVGPVTAQSSAGDRLGAVHPQLLALADRVLEPTEPAVLGAADLVFLALPHGASAAVAEALPAHLPVVDLGADFRLADPAAWGSAYGGRHAGHWPYGLPELPGARDAIRATGRVAAPGCYPTAVALGLAPLLAAGLVEPADIVVVAASGVSGAGRKASAAQLAAERMGDLQAYRVGGQHQHLPEIVQTLSAAAGDEVTVSFTPVLAPLPRGILATCTARLRPGVDAAALRAAATAAYEQEPFVHVLPEGEWPRTAATLGSNSAQLQVTAEVTTGRAVVVVAIDNLGKGAAGQAIQCANLLLGMPEESGLPVNGIAP